MTTPTVQTPDPNAAPDATPDPNAAPPPITPEQIRAMLNLPPDATDADVIMAEAAVISYQHQEIAGLKADAQALQGQNTALQGHVTNRDLEDFKDVIKPETTEFWTGQLLTNRADAIVILNGLRTAPVAPAPVAPPAEPVQLPTPRTPLANRIAAPAVTPVSTLASDAPLADRQRAEAIRNRAHELRKAGKIAWSVAFKQAEKEIIK